MSNFFNSKTAPEYETLHSSPEQLKRQKSACDKKLTPVSVESDHAIFKGSAKTPYTASLESCTCADFIRRKLPCKHMYRFAYYNQNFPLPSPVQENSFVKLSENSSDSFQSVLSKDCGDIVEVISANGAKKLIESYSAKYLLVLKDIMYHMIYRGKNPFFVFLTPIINDLIGDGILQVFNGSLHESIVKCFQKRPYTITFLGWRFFG